MRIYLDQCIIQDLKREAGPGLLKLIEEDNLQNIYCFSEAHLYDLRRDATDEKYRDMELLEKVAGSNCFTYENGHVEFNYYSPREYYERFNWEQGFKPNDDSDPYMVMLMSLFKSVPLSFTTLIREDQLPLDMPAEFRNLFLETTNFYEFFNGFLDFSSELSDKQKRFKVFLQYLHKHNFMTPVYGNLGIEGFNGTEITDRELFFKTYSDYCAKITSNKSTYNVFLTMYYALELLGIVKGKPQKQKLMNLINDARHAFFGCYADIVVSSDEDFLKKTSFVYEAMGIWPMLLDLSEFKNWIEREKYKDDNIPDLVNMLPSLSSDAIFDQQESNGMDYTSYWLPHYYLNYFNMATIGIDSEEVFFYFSNRHSRFSNGILTQEIERLTKLLTRDLGEDLQKKGSFTDEEKSTGEWKGRAWQYGDTIVELIINTGLQLTFNSIKNAD